MTEKKEKTPNTSLNPQCRLCRGETKLFFEKRNEKYYQCLRCFALFLNPANYLTKKEEKNRYLEHNNDVEDPGYQEFVEPIVSLVSQKFSQKSQGLDFGAGTGPVAARLLQQKGYAVQLYDPFFWNNPKALNRKYNFIICCEVIEHFHFPLKEFKLLKSLLKPGGSLICMTDLYSEEIDFKKWYYKDDPTHVFFYHQNTLTKIASLIKFSSMESKGRVVEFFN